MRRRWLASGEAEWRWVVGCVDRGWLRVQGKKETVEVWVVFGRGQGEEENRLVSVFR
jgi:hypothetical protein